MTAPCLDVCSAWADDADLCSNCDDYDAVVVTDENYLAASNLLYQLTGSRWPGSCQDTVRPCQRRSDTSWRPIRGGAMGGLAYGLCGCGCQCGAIDLGAYPVTGIDTVKVDATTLDSTLYQVHDFRWLVRRDNPDGTNPGWPTSQDLTADPDIDDDTFEVTFTYGTAPPAGGAQAAAELACELALACQPENASQCRLPPGLQTMAREGVTMQIESADPDDFFGLPAVRRFLQAYRKTRGGQVMIPGRRRRTVRVT